MKHSGDIWMLSWFVMMIAFLIAQTGSSNKSKEIKVLKDEAIERGYAELVVVGENKTEFQWTAGTNAME